MGELASRRPQSVADHATVDYAKALQYLGLNAASPQAHALVLVCQRYNLDPLLGHVSLYDGKPYVHFAGYLHIANSHPQFDGIECMREWEDDTHYLATVRVHRNDRSYPAERTGRSAKLKRKKDGGRYEDEHADAKAFAQAARRALRMAFNVDHPDPAEDHSDVPVAAPAPVVEVARTIQNAKTGGAGGTGGRGSSGQPAPSEESGAGSRGPTDVSGDGASASPAPGDQSGGGGRPVVSEAPPPDPTSDPGDPLPPSPPGSDPMSEGEVPGSASAGSGSSGRGLAAPPTAGAVNTSSPDPTSPSVSTGKATGGDPTSTPAASEGEAIEEPDNVGEPAVRGDQLTEGNTAGDLGKSDDAAGPSPVMAWCEANQQDIRVARIHLRKTHRTDFGDLTDITELKGLRGERADRAIAYLDAWHQAGQEGR